MYRHAYDSISFGCVTSYTDSDSPMLNHCYQLQLFQKGKFTSFEKGFHYLVLIIGTLGRFWNFWALNEFYYVEIVTLRVIDDAS